MSNITMIAAVGKNNEIGADNKLLWHYKKDMEFFRNNTICKPIVMGRKTFESLPRLLPCRTHIVLTKKNIDIPEVLVVHSKEDVLILQRYFNEIMIIGGESIYNLFLDEASKMLLTRVNKSYNNADAFFPLFNENDWDIKEIKKEYENDTLLEFNQYTRKLVKKN